MSSVRPSVVCSASPSFRSRVLGRKLVPPQAAQRVNALQKMQRWRFCGEATLIWHLLWSGNGASEASLLGVRSAQSVYRPTTTPAMLPAMPQRVSTPPGVRPSMHRPIGRSLNSTRLAFLTRPHLACRSSATGDSPRKVSPSHSRVVRSVLPRLT